MIKGNKVCVDGEEGRVGTGCKLAMTRRNNGRKEKEEERGKYKVDKFGKNFY